MSDKIESEYSPGTLVSVSDKLLEASTTHTIQLNKIMRYFTSVERR